MENSNEQLLGEDEVTNSAGQIGENDDLDNGSDLGGQDLDDTEDDGAGLADQGDLDLDDDTETGLDDGDELSSDDGDDLSSDNDTDEVGTGIDDDDEDVDAP